MTHVDPSAVRALIASAGFKIRYGAGASEEIANAIGGRRHGLIARAYNLGFQIPQYGDMASALWIGQGIYRARRAALLDSGMDAGRADRRALAETWNIISATQQSARQEHLPQILRTGGSAGKLLFQFVTSPAQQLAFEIQAVREAWAQKGANGSWGRAARIVAINHVLVPALMALAGSAWRWVLGYPDDENEDRFWKEAAVAMAVGPLGGMFMAGAMGEAGIGALISGKRDWRGHGLPVENIFQVVEAGGITLHDLFIEFDSEKIKEDLLRLLSSVSAPVRHIQQAVKNRAD
jgi:hypothetical protein